MPLRWLQDTGVQTAQYNKQHNAWHFVKASWSRNTAIPTGLDLHYQTKSSMISSLTFQDGQSAPSLSQQKPHSLSQETFSDQRSIQNINQGQDRNQDLEDREAVSHPNSSPGSPNEQQHVPPNSKFMSTSNLNLNLPHI